MQDSVDEGLIGNINHMPANLLNINIFINSLDSKETEVSGHTVLKNKNKNVSH